MPTVNRDPMLIRNTRVGPNKGVGNKISQNNGICCTIIRQVRLPLYLYENLRDENCTIISWINRKDNSYGSQEILLCLKIGLPTNQTTTIQQVKTVLIYGVQVVGKQTSVVGMMHHARLQKQVEMYLGLFVNRNKRFLQVHNHIS